MRSISVYFLSLALLSLCCFLFPSVAHSTLPFEQSGEDSQNVDSNPSLSATVRLSGAASIFKDAQKVEEKTKEKRLLQVMKHQSWAESLHRSIPPSFNNSNNDNDRDMFIEDEEVRNMTKLGYILIPEFLKAHRRAHRLSTIPERYDEQVHIGRSSVAARRVTAVGDIDRNGATDYIVATPSSANFSGSVRLYLMAKGRDFLYTRDLVPGRPGFPAHRRFHVRPGFLYGSGVTLLGTNSTYTFVAVSAPGDHSVYVLKVDRRGGVSKFTKSTHHAAHVQHDPSPAQALRVLDGVTTLLFEAADGEVLAKLQIDPARDRALLAAIERGYILPTHNESVATTPVRVLAPMAGRGAEEEEEGEGEGDEVRFEAECLYNETHCACGEVLMHTTFENDLRLESVGKDKAGNDLCVIDHAEHERLGHTHASKPKLSGSLACKCDGDRMCRHQFVERDEWRLREDLSITDDMTLSSTRRNRRRQHFQCSKMRSLNFVIEPIAEATVVHHGPKLALDAFNESHCICHHYQSKRLSVADDCLSFHHIQKSRAVYCYHRMCAKHALHLHAYKCDLNGHTYCERTIKKIDKWVFDGVVPNHDDDLIYCHHQHTVVDSAIPIFHF